MCLRCRSQEKSLALMRRLQTHSGWQNASVDIAEKKNIYPQTVLLEERNLLGLILKQQKELFLVSETEVIRNLNVHNKFLNGIGFACVAKQEVSVQLELIDNYVISR